MLASSLIQDLRNSVAPADVLMPVGSLRRYAPDVGHVSLFAAAPVNAREQILRVFTRLPSVQRVSALRALVTSCGGRHFPDLTVGATTCQPSGPKLTGPTVALA